VQSILINRPLFLTSPAPIVMKTTFRPFALGVLLGCAWHLAAPGLRAQAAPASVCEGPDLHARVAADPHRIATADDRISLVPPEGLSALADTSRERMEDPPELALTHANGPARIWLRYVPASRRLDASGARAWLSALDGQVARLYGGIAWIAREAVAVDETRWGIRLEFTGRMDGVDEHGWIWATPFGTSVLVASFASPAAEPRWTEAMARSVATLEVRDCAVRWPLAAFVDSAALVRDVAGLPEPSGLPPGVRPLFYVSYDSVGAGVKVTPVVDRIPESYAGPVAAAIRAHLKARPPYPGRPVFTLRVVAGPHPLVDSPEVVERAPALRRGERERMTRELLRLPKPRREPPPTGYRYVVRLRLLADGTLDPALVTLERSPGIPELDAGVLRLVRTLRFNAATVEGIPVAVWMKFPINIEP